MEINFINQSNFLHLDTNFAESAVMCIIKSGWQAMALSLAVNQHAWKWWWWVLISRNAEGRFVTQ